MTIDLDELERLATMCTERIKRHPSVYVPDLRGDPVAVVIGREDAIALIERLRAAEAEVKDLERALASYQQAERERLQ